MIWYTILDNTLGLISDPCTQPPGVAAETPEILVIFPQKETRWTNASMKVVAKTARVRWWRWWTPFGKMSYGQWICKNDRRAITTDRQKHDLYFSAKQTACGMRWHRPCPWKGHVPVETVIHPGSPWSMPNFVWNTRLDRLAYLSLSLSILIHPTICCNKANYAKIRNHVTSNANIWYHSLRSTHAARERSLQNVHIAVYLIEIKTDSQNFREREREREREEKTYRIWTCNDQSKV